MTRKIDSRPRGRMTAYAYFVQSRREEHKKLHPEVSVVFGAFSKKCAEEWKAMSDENKKRFHEMAENDKKRYESEMKNYMSPQGGYQSHNTNGYPKPKRPISAFFWFGNEQRGNVKAQNPHYTFGAIAKELGRMWAETSSESRSKYEALAAADKARYESEMAALHTASTATTSYN